MKNHTLKLSLPAKLGIKTPTVISLWKRSNSSLYLERGKVVVILPLYKKYDRVVNNFTIT